MIPLPKRVKTQFPNKENIATDERVPIPIETTFFLEDAEQDQTRMNRYYFNFPAEWSTANNGESIVGVRSMWLVAKRRKLEYNLSVFKVKREVYDEVAKTHEGVDQICNQIMNIQIYDEELKRYVDKYKEFIDYNWENLKIVDWLSTEGDLRGIFDAVHEAYKAHIDKWFTNSALFEQNDKDVLNRDIQADGYYDEKGFHEIIYSPRNDNKMDDFYVFFSLLETNDDFKEVFNIGNDPTENNEDNYISFRKELVFHNIWDRHSCKVYSSIAEQSLHHYIGNSQIYFSPIKYYKLNSSDQRFWIELYSGRNYNVPIKLPKNESFVIEMQFLPYNKLLYV